MLKRESGFTLVELVVTMVITGVVILGIANLYLVIEKTQRDSLRLEMATRAAESEIETLRNEHYNTLTPGENIDFSATLPDELPEPRVGTVVVTEPTSGLRKVDVTVSYGNGSTTKQVSLSSLIGVIGIGQ